MTHHPKYAIEVEGVSKEFRTDISLRSSFKESIQNTLFGSSKKGQHVQQALDNISFKVEAGSTLGLIGRNGSGKSTLLRLLSGITEPSAGSIVTRGRVTSILDIGSGFHLDLSGRENVILSGGLMGMDEESIKTRLPEIIAFSEIADHIDVPVKYYSSGMYLRLAFALAVNLDFDILLIDEVIEVGDEAFKIKSYNKLKQLTGSGRTILICTHNMRSVAELCTKCLVMEKGKIVAQGDPTDMVQTYLEDIWAKSYELDKDHIPLSYTWDADKAPKNDWVQIDSFNFKQDGATDKLYTIKPLEIEVHYQKLKPESHIDLGVWVYDHLHKPVMASNCMAFTVPTDNEPAGHYKAVLDIPAHFFARGLFFLRLHFLKDNKDLVFEYPGDLPFKMHMETIDPNNLKIDGKMGSPIYFELPWSKNKL